VPVSPRATRCHLVSATYSQELVIRRDRCAVKRRHWRIEQNATPLPPSNAGTGGSSRTPARCRRKRRHLPDGNQPLPPGLSGSKSGSRRHGGAAAPPSYAASGSARLARRDYNTHSLSQPFTPGESVRTHRFEVCNFGSKNRRVNLGTPGSAASFHVTRTLSARAANAGPSCSCKQDRTGKVPPRDQLIAMAPKPGSTTTHPGACVGSPAAAAAKDGSAFRDGAEPGDRANVPGTMRKPHPPRVNVHIRDHRRG